MRKCQQERLNERGEKRQEEDNLPSSYPKSTGLLECKQTQCQLQDNRDDYSGKTSVE